MAEFCLDCLNKTCGTKFCERDSILSDELDLCEECGEWKRVVVVKRKGRLFTAARGFIYRMFRR